MEKSRRSKPFPCPCGSGRDSENCCLPLIRGESPARTAEALMRSRYTAFVLGEEAYLLESWSGKTRPGALRLDLSTRYLPLEILSKEQGAEGDTEGVVEFRTGYREKGKRTILWEKSRFVREEGAWRYRDGEHSATEEPDSLSSPDSSSSADLSGPPRSSRKPGRNDPCPCGSGKKFKKCCGKS